MIYRDYSRKEGEWIPNEFGGARILKRLNSCVIPTVFLVRGFRCGDNGGGVYRFPWRFSSQDMGGLGFWYKWNLGWMHDPWTT